MPAPRLAGRIVSALICAIFLLSFAGCLLDMDKVKEDAYKQGYEQGLKDEAKKHAPITAPSWIPEREKVTTPSNIYIPNYYGDSYEWPEDFKTMTTPEDDPNYTQRLEDKIRQLESDLNFERFKSESERIQLETELWYYKNKLKNQ